MRVEAHRWLYHSTLNSRVIKKKKKVEVVTVPEEMCSAAATAFERPVLKLQSRDY